MSTPPPPPPVVDSRFSRAKSNERLPYPRPDGISCYRPSILCLLALVVAGLVFGSIAPGRRRLPPGRLGSRSGRTIGPLGGDDASTAGPSQPCPGPSAVDTAARVVVVGDLHGDLEKAVAVLRVSGLVHGGLGAGSSLSWTGGDTVLVQTGDIVDRGPQSGEILALMDRLGGEARAVGGDVVLLLGNHELMNVCGDLRYVGDDLEFWHGSAEARAASFSVRGALGRELRCRRTAVRVNGDVFVHAGILPEFAQLGLDGINRAMVAAMETSHEWCFSKRTAKPAIAGRQGPVWTRHLSAPRVPVEDMCKRLDHSLELLNGGGSPATRDGDDGGATEVVPPSRSSSRAMRRMIVGHTIQDDGQIHRRHCASGADLILIDVGMSAWVDDATVAALEVFPNETSTVLTVDRLGRAVRVPLEGWA